MCTKSRSTVFSLLIVAALVFMAFQPVQAQVFGQGGLGLASFTAPIPPQAGVPFPGGTGFPVAFTDTLGISLAQCLDGGPNCLPLDVGIPGNLTVLPPPGSFPSEFFYWIAGPTNLPVPATVGVTVIEYALEGGWGGTGAVVNGQQAVFQRIRYRLTGLQAGSNLTITHPWGTDVMTADALGEVNDTLDIPGLVAGQFAVAQAATLFGPFLTAVAPAPPAGFVGTCGGNQTVTGGVNGNSLTLDGTDSAGVAFSATTDTWDVCGKLFAGAVTLPQVHLHRDVTGLGRIDIDVIGLSVTGQIQVSGVTVTPPVPLPGQPVSLTPAVGRPGSFVASVPVAAGAAVPGNVFFTIDPGTPTSGVSPNIPVTDLVTISDAVLDDLANTLTVTAASSNLFAPVPTLSVTAPVPGAVGVPIPGVTTIPATVTVTSSAGGTATAPVRVINVVTPGVPGPLAPGVGGGGGGGGCFIDSIFGR